MYLIVPSSIPIVAPLLLSAIDQVLSISVDGVSHRLERRLFLLHYNPRLDILDAVNMNNNTKRYKRAAYKDTVAKTGKPPQFVKPVGKTHGVAQLTRKDGKRLGGN